VPNAASINALTAPTTDVFNVEVSDGSLSAATTLTVNITGANDAPTITAETATPTLVDTAALDSFAPVTGQLDGFDVDTGASLSYQIAGATPVSGDTVLAGDYGTLTVHANAATATCRTRLDQRLTAPTTDVFNVEVSDGSLSAATTLTVNITGANDAPTLLPRRRRRPWSTRPPSTVRAGDRPA